MTIKNRKIVIKYNREEEIMEISNGKEVVFHGTYWDFDRNPRLLKKFLVRLGLTVKCTKTLKSQNNFW